MNARYKYVYAVTEHEHEKPLEYFVYFIDAEEYAEEHGGYVIEIKVIERPETVEK